MRSYKEVKEDIEYLRVWEDIVSSLLAGNVGYSLFKKFMDGKSEAQEEIRNTTLEYLSKISELRKKYEKEREKLLKSGKQEEPK